MNLDGLILPFFACPAQHLLRLFSDRQYLSYCILASRYGGAQRYVPKEVRVTGKTIQVPDLASFLSTYREIFVENIYRFSFNNDSPKILDLGANIGLSVLYFKQLFPGAVITAFEADPQIFNYLEKNVVGNGFHDVRLINAAAWISSGTLRFSSDGADGGRVGADGVVDVDSVDIRDYLQGVDFLKMDIEGAEQVIIPACKGLLQHVSYVFIEYHSRPSEQQNLAEILNVLNESGFRIHIHNHQNRVEPLISKLDSLEFDMQLNIFGWKE